MLSIIVICLSIFFPLSDTWILSSTLPLKNIFAYCKAVASSLFLSNKNLLLLTLSHSYLERDTSLVTFPHLS